MADAALAVVLCRCPSAWLALVCANGLSAAPYLSGPAVLSTTGEYLHREPGLFVFGDGLHHWGQ